MKRKILLRIILLSLALLVIPLFYITSYTQQNPDPDNTFLVGVQAMGYNSIEGNPYDVYLWSEQMPYIKDSLGMNFISLFANESITPPFDGGIVR